MVHTILRPICWSSFRDPTFRVVLQWILRGHLLFMIHRVSNATNMAAIYQWTVSNAQHQQSTATAFHNGLLKILLSSTEITIIAKNGLLLHNLVSFEVVLKKLGITDSVGYVSFMMRSYTTINHGHG